jgi:hypothetical protein
MSTILFLALAVLGSGDYTEHESSVEYFNSFNQAYGLEYVGESYGVRVSCNHTYEICFASDGEAVLKLVKD